MILSFETSFVETAIPNYNATLLERPAAPNLLDPRRDHEIARQPTHPCIALSADGDRQPPELSNDDPAPI